MTAREKAIEAIHDAGDRFYNVAPETALDALEAAGLRVIEEPEAPYDTNAKGPVWVGSDWSLVALSDGGIELDVADDASPGGQGPTYAFERDIVAAIHAAHVRAEDYR